MGLTCNTLTNSNHGASSRPITPTTLMWWLGAMSVLAFMQLMVNVKVFGVIAVAISMDSLANVLAMTFQIIGFVFHSKTKRML